MPPYRASLGGAFGGGVQRGGERPPLDVGQIIDALTNGASSLIHGAYVRKQATEQRRIAEEQRQLENTRYTEKSTRDEEHWQAEHQLKTQQEEREALTAGVTPSREGGTTVAIAPPATPAPVPTRSIKDAMTAGMTAPAAPTSSLERPVTPGSMGTIPQLAVGEAPPVAATYDPTKSATYARQKQLSDDRIAAHTSDLKYLRETGLLIQSKRNEGRPGANGAISKEMTGNVKQQTAQRMAEGLIGQTNGDVDRAEALLATPEGAEHRKIGITRAHLLYAASKLMRSREEAALKLVGSNFSPTEAAATVDSTVTAVRGAPKPRALEKPAAAAPVAAPKGGASITSTTKPLPPLGRITEQEMDGAHDAGVKDDDVAGLKAWVRAHRAKKGQK